MTTKVETKKEEEREERETNAFIDAAVGDPVIVPHRNGRIKTGVVTYLENQHSKPATCWDDVKWIRVQFDDDGEGVFYHTSVRVDLDWMKKISEYTD